MRIRNMAWTRALPFLFVGLTAAVGLAVSFAYTKYDTGTSKAEVSFYWRPAQRVKITSLAAKSDQADQLVFYKRQTSAIYYAADSADTGQKVWVCATADTTAIDSHAWVFVQDDSLKWWWCDSIGARNVDTCTMAVNLAYKLRTEDKIVLMNVGWLHPVRVGTTEILSGNPLYITDKSSPLYVKLGGSSACTLFHVTGEYE